MTDHTITQVKILLALAQSDAPLTYRGISAIAGKRSGAAVRSLENKGEVSELRSKDGALTFGLTARGKISVESLKRAFPRGL